MPGRKFTGATNYRYGFNGKEEDDEVKGDGNQQDYGMRIYDARLGRFLSVDPITEEYPELSTYQFSSNSPITFIDLDGLEMAAPDLSFKSWLGKPVLTLTNTKTDKPKSNLMSIAWRGVKDSYKDTKSLLSLSSIKKNYNNAAGTIKDIGQMSIGKPDAAKSFSNRIANFSIGISKSVTQPVEFALTFPKRTSEENAYGIGYFGFQLGLAYVASRFFESISESSSIATGDFETMYRVQGGGSKTRFVISANEIAIAGDDMLFINIGQETRAMTFLAKRGEDAVLLKFKIDKAFLEKLRKDAVPQNTGRLFPGRPQLVDPTKATDQFGVPKAYFNDLLKSIDAKSVEVIKKGG